MADFFAADRLRVGWQGKQAQLLLTAAAAAGVRLRRVRCAGQGYAATIAGRDLRRLRALARTQGMQLQLLRRVGPGRLAARLWARPGVLAGAALFAVLVWWCGGYVWTIDFGTLDADAALAVRAVLAEQGIREGSRPDAAQLQAARQSLAAGTASFGWVELNFAAGRLTVESTPLAQQPVRTATPETALYAAADAEVLAVRVESGFAAAAPGQYVAKGQLLANAQRADRDGDPVYQSASGSVIGRMRLTVTATQPLTAEAVVLTGRCTVRRTLYLAGACLPLDETAAPADALAQQSWQPLQLGRLALPGCLHTVRYWVRAAQTVTYTPQAAAALARRSCRQQLLAAWPDAQIEQQTLTCQEENGAVHCRAEYVFCADIAVPGPMQPLGKTAGE